MAVVFHDGPASLTCNQWFPFVEALLMYTRSGVDEPMNDALFGVIRSMSPSRSRSPHVLSYAPIPAATPPAAVFRPSSAVTSVNCQLPSLRKRRWLLPAEARLSWK